MRLHLCVGVFLLAVLSSCQSFVVTNAPFTSRKSPAETISQYAIVHPIVSSAGQSHQGHPLELTVIIQVDSTTGFEILLALNHKLLPPDFLTAHYDDDGEMVYGTHQNCFYQGKVVGHPKWIAEFSTCSGLRGSFGDLQDSHSYYHLEPLGDSNTFDQPHAVYMDSEHKTGKHGTCGTTHNPSTSNMDTERLFHTLDASSKRLKRQNSNGLRVVEWLVVNDFVKYSIIYNNNRTATELRSIEIANTMDMLYTSLGIRVVLVHMITITSAANQFSEPTESGALLNAFRSYHETLPTTIQHDSAMLMTGINLDGSTIGIAFTGTMCRGSDSVGVTQDTGGQLAGVSATAAHEMGHIFNMLHDDDVPNRVCSCGADDPRCIMRSSISFPAPTAWSDCSTSDLNVGYSTRNTGVCLDNDPSVIVGTATCGNGIKEPGETCDCGPAQTCNDPCCNATSCELRSTAQCAAGACCQDCQFKAYGTICRPDSDECGLSEYCTGDNAECPSNVFRQDGQPCANNTAYCFGGECISHDLQCKLYYGQSSATSQPVCYTTNNVVGDIQGHCGTRNNTFVPCSQANTLCGSIQCNGGNFNQSSIIFRTTLRLITTFAGPEDDRCSTFTTDATADEVSPGLVLDGTRCGNEMLCKNSQCVPVSSLSILPCPVGSNAVVCSANGVCSNLNQCFCNVGFTGSSCSDTTTGPGGSTGSPDLPSTNTPPSTTMSTGSRVTDPTMPGGGNGGNVNQTVIVNTTVGLAVGLTFLFLFLIGGAVAVAVVILIFFVVVRKNKSKSTTVTKARYSHGNSTAKGVSSKNTHGSQDDLLSGMESHSPPQSHRRPPPTMPGYKPPAFNSPPTVTVSNNSTANTNNVRKPPPPRPPPSRPLPDRRPPPPYNPAVSFVPPSKPTPPPSKPAFVPVPPTNPKPAPKPRTAPPQPTTKPAVIKPVITPKPIAPPSKPATTPKPTKLQRQWPPSNDASSGKPSPPQPPKKPIAPPRR